MELQEMKAITLDILQSVDDVYDKDVVLAEMYARDIPFSKLNMLYKDVGIENGLLVDRTKLKDSIVDVLSRKMILSFDNYAAVLALVRYIKEEVNGAPDDLILKVMRTYYREQDILIPRKSRAYAPRGPRGGKIAEAVVNYAHSTDPNALSRRGLYDALRPHVKKPKNAYDQVNAYFTIVYGLTHKVDYLTAVEAVKELPLLNLEELGSA